jgi:hypothetical protein
MRYRRGFRREARLEGSGWGEGRTRVARRGRGGQGRHQARSNGVQSYLIACGVHGSATAKVGSENCARGGTAGGFVGSGQQSVARRGVGVWAAGAIKGALERRSAAGVRMQKERVHTVRSSKSWSTGVGGAGEGERVRG